MSEISPTLNGIVLTGLEWDEGVSTAALIADDPVDLLGHTEPLVGAVVSIEDDILVVELPSRYLDTCARSLIHSLEIEGLTNERYPHTLTDPDGVGGKGIKVDIIHSPDSVAAVSQWLSEHDFDQPVAFRGGFEPAPAVPRLRR